VNYVHNHVTLCTPVRRAVFTLPYLYYFRQHGVCRLFTECKGCNMDADGFVLRGSNSWIFYYDTNGSSAGEFSRFHVSVLRGKEVRAHLQKVAKLKANLRHQITFNYR